MTNNAIIKLLDTNICGDQNEYATHILNYVINASTGETNNNNLLDSQLILFAFNKLCSYNEETFEKDLKVEANEIVL